MDIRTRLNNMSVGWAIAVIVVSGLGILTMLINQVFTFTFGFDVVGGFLLGGLLSPEVSAIASGIIALVLFDWAYIGGLLGFIWLSDSIWQRAVLGLQIFFTFCCSVGGSVVSIALLSGLREFIPETLSLLFQYTGGGLLVSAFIVNALGLLGLIVFHPGIRARLQESSAIAKQRETDFALTDRVNDETNAQVFHTVMGTSPRLAFLEARGRVGQVLTSRGLDAGRWLPFLMPQTEDDLLQPYDISNNPDSEQSNVVTLPDGFADSLASAVVSALQKQASTSATRPVVTENGNGPN